MHTRCAASARLRAAQAACDQGASAQGLAYGSRRHDAGRCLMLFGQRLDRSTPRLVADEPLALGPRRAAVLALVRSLGLWQV